MIFGTLSWSSSRVAVSGNSQINETGPPSVHEIWREYAKHVTIRPLTNGNNAYTDSPARVLVIL